MNLIRTLSGVVAFEEESSLRSVVLHLIMIDLLLQLALFMMKATYSLSGKMVGWTFKFKLCI